MHRLLPAFVLLLVGSGAFAQNPIVPTAPPNTNTNQAASTAFVQQEINSHTGPVIAPVIKCDGSDNHDAIQNAINTLSALSPPGGTVKLPACNNIGLNSGLLISTHRIFLEGTGGSGRTAVAFTSQTLYAGNANASSVLVALSGLSGGTMLTIDPAAGGQSIKSGGVSGIVFAGMGIADKGVVIRSTESGQYGVGMPLLIENVNVTGLELGITQNAVLAGEGNSQGNMFGTIIVSVSLNPASTAACVTIPSQTLNAGNFSQNLFQFLHCDHRAGVGMQVGDTDNNTFLHMEFSGPGPGIDLELLGNSSARTARLNYFGKIETSQPSGGGVVARGTTSFTNPSQSNVIAALGSNNVVFVAPTIETGAGLTWSSLVSPATSNAPPQTTNKIINGNFAINQHQGTGALTPPGNGNFPVDMWRNFGAGFFNGIAYQQETTIVPPTAGTSEKFSVANQTTPGAGDYVAFCQRIEGPDVADLGFGTTGASDIVVTFMDREPFAGNYSVWFQNAAASRFLVKSYNIPTANTWTYVSMRIPGDTGGTWSVAEGTVGLQFCFDMGTGSNFQTATTGVWGGSFVAERTGDIQRVAQVNGSASYISNVRLIKGSADPPYAARSYQQELALVQRYLFSTFPPGTAIGTQKGVAGSVCTQNPIANGNPSVYVGFPSRMAKNNPAIVTYNPNAGSNNANWRNFSAGADVVPSVDPATSQSAQGVLIGTGATVATIAHILCIHLSASGEL